MINIDMLNKELKKRISWSLILTWIRLKENLEYFALPFRWEGVEVIEWGIGERSSSILLKLWRTIGVIERIGGWNDIGLNIGELRNGVNEYQSGLNKIEFDLYLILKITYLNTGWYARTSGKSESCSSWLEVILDGLILRSSSIVCRKWEWKSSEH
jgi:hypothetical protein